MILSRFNVKRTHFLLFNVKFQVNYNCMNIKIDY